MDKKTLIAWLVLIVIIIAVVGAFAFLSHREPPPTPTDAGTSVVFTDPDTKESVTVVFDQSHDTAALTGLGYAGTTLHLAVAASGARYVNEAENLEVWNRGNDVTISKDGREIFSGNVGGQTDADKLEEATWSWQATTIGDAVTEPSSTVFTLTFDKAVGTVHGTTDCNNFSGQYTVGANNSLSFGPLAMTKKFCEGSQEGVYVDALANVRSFSFAGSGALVLELASSSGSMLFGK